MKFSFKKISAIATSVLLTGMTIGVAAAANYPAPFVAGGNADVAIVYGTGSGVSALDAIEAGNIQTNLQSYMGGGSGSSTTVSGDAWEVGTSSNSLEIGESIADVDTYIDESDLAILADQEISNEKGTAAYEQYLYFNDAVSSSVNFTEDDDENVGLFLKFNSGVQIARYVMDFTTNLESDIETDNELSDIEDKEITILGKTYTIVVADNTSNSADLTLMSGALKGTINNDEELTLGSYTVSATISSSTEVQFTVNGEILDKMNKGGMEKLSDGNYIAVTDITYESYAGGIHAATFYIGADKIELIGGSNMKVNAETINNAAVTITETISSGDIAISEISVNMTAEDDLYVPMGGKLSEATDLDEPEVLLTQNWDIQFTGLESAEYEDFSLKSSSGDEVYEMEFENYNGDVIKFPVCYSNTTGMYPGKQESKQLVLYPNGTALNITKYDYFILNTADPTSVGNNARSFVLQYKGADKSTDSNPKATFDILGVDDSREASITTGAAGGNFSLKVGGTTFNFYNTSAASSDDFQIAVNGPVYTTSVGNSVNGTAASAYLRTKNEALITITDTNFSEEGNAGDERGLWADADFTVNMTLDDTDRDGDHLTLSNEVVFHIALANDSDGDIGSTVTESANPTWVADPEDSDIKTYINAFGVELTQTDTSSAPAQLEVKIPDAAVRPIVLVSSGDVSVTTSTSGATQLGEILVKDSDVSSVSSKNLIIVGGSCINSAAANVLGGAYCGAAFTDATGVGSGQFLIKGVTGKYATGKLALVVAGYEAADTVNAAKYLRTQTVDTSKEYVGTTATSATLVVSE